MVIGRLPGGNSVSLWVLGTRPKTPLPLSPRLTAMVQSHSMTTFQRFQPALFEFLEQLADNNNRHWFQENKGRYEQEVLGPSLDFIRAFQPKLKRISSCFVASDRRVGGSLMRVYRDTRFAKGGSPTRPTSASSSATNRVATSTRRASTSTSRRASASWPSGFGGRKPSRWPLSARRSWKSPTLGPRPRRSQIPRPFRLGRRQPEASAPRFSCRSRAYRRHQADRFHRGGSNGRAQRSRQGLLGSRGGVVHRRAAVHAISLRSIEDSILRCVRCWLHLSCSAAWYGRLSNRKPDDIRPRPPRRAANYLGTADTGTAPAQFRPPALAVP